KENRERGFDLCDDPLFRVAVFRKEKGRFTLIVSYHHIILDGWSFANLLWRIIERYIKVKAGCPELCSPMKDVFGDYLRWVDQQDSDVAHDYWRDYLEGSSGIASVFSKDANVNEVPARTDRYSKEFSVDFTQKLNELAKDRQATLNHVIQTVWGVLLHQRNQTDDVVYCGVNSGRSAAIEEITEGVGLFINSVPIRVRTRVGQTVSELIEEQREMFLKGERYSYLPLGDVNQYLDVQDRHFDHIFMFESYPLDQISESAEESDEHGFDVTEISTVEQTNYHLDIVFVPGKQLEFRIDYDVDSYDRLEIERVGRQFCYLLEQVVENPDTLVSELKISDDKERDRLTLQYNDTATPLDENSTVVDLFRGAVRDFAGKTAVSDGKNTLTYSELDECSSRLAARLLREGVKVGETVALMVGRSVDLIVAQIGILKAGASYLPIDTVYPISRIEYMLDAANVRLMVSGSNVSSRPNFSGHTIYVENVYESQDVEKIDFADVDISGSDLAYLIFTSGSTGAPKGVEIEHRNVVNLVGGMSRSVGLSSSERMLSVTTISFDIYVLESLVALAFGMTVVMADEETQVDPSLLLEFIENEGVDVVQMTPSLASLLIDEGPRRIEALGKVKKMLIGGEAFPSSILVKLQDVTKASVYNMYGPTETTVWSSVKELTDVDITVGRPIDNTRLYVLDEKGVLLPEGIQGEVWIGGSGVGRGYLGDETLTNERFRSDPFLKGERMYRTGDVGYWTVDGEIRVLGRSDNQIKLNGYRIELEEIESALDAIEGVNDSVVSLVGDETQSLRAFLLSDSDLDVEAIVGKLRERLPDYMVPSGFIRVDEIPRTLNGKRDRKALEEMDFGLVDVPSVRSVPQSKMESEILEIWKDVLGKSEIGMEEDFFVLGGRSILAIQIVSRFREQFGIELPLRLIFEERTIAKIAVCVENIIWASESTSRDECEMGVI
ncbi:MAG: amino acid adenylation domain-containing protein, partial [Symploca sp. SIO2D2]|nr:amino acid adenylation domain-containing protein [Symploca sp. SIO2D2]